MTAQNSANDFDSSGISSTAIVPAAASVVLTDDWKTKTAAAYW